MSSTEPRRFLFLGHNILYTRSVTRGNRTPGSRDATGCNSLGGHSLCGNEVEESTRAMAAEGKTKALNSTTEMNFSNKIVRLGHCTIVIMKI